MEYVEYILAFIAGAAIAGLLGLVFSLKTKGFIRILINLLAGVIALVVLNLFKVPYFPLNALNVFIVGILGVPGLVLILIIRLFL